MTVLRNVRVSVKALKLCAHKIWNRKKRCATKRVAVRIWEACTQRERTMYQAGTF